MIKTVIFDIDNTLYNYNTANAAAMDALCQYTHTQFGLSREESLSGMANAMTALAQRLGDTAAAHNRLIRCHEFLLSRDLPIFPHAMTMASLYWDTLIDASRPESGILSLMNALKDSGVRIGIGTDMTAMIQFRKLTALGLDRFIDFVAASEAAGAEKPSKPFYDLVLSFCRCRPEECVFIGDNLAKDVLGARAAGMQGVWYRPAALIRADDPTDIPQIRSYTDCISEDSICLAGIRISGTPRRSSQGTPSV